MGVKITDIIGEFPTGDEYQVVDVTQISKKGMSKSLKVIFQRLYVGEFEAHIKYIDISYTRLIVIGTIWRNKSKVKLPTFLEKYQAFNLDFSKLEISSEKFEFEEFGSDYIQQIQKERKESSFNLITYNVPLSVADKKDGIIKLFEPNPEWEKQKLIKFISFFPHEVLRYFLTSNEIGDLNSILYGFKNVDRKWTQGNSVFDTIKSVEKKGEFNVTLLNNKYMNDSDFIGDAIYLDSFSRLLFSIQNFLNVRGFYYLSNIKEAPIKNCKRLTFSGLTITRKSDGAKGLLGFLIEECTSYRSHEYTVTLPRTENKDGGSRENKTPVPVRTSGRGSNNENSTPVVSRSSTRSNKKHEIDETGLEFLLIPKKPSNIKYEPLTSQSSAVFVNPEEKNEIRHPNEHGDSGGKTPKPPECFKQTIYFEFYKEIIISLKNTLEKDNFAVTMRHCNSDKHWSTDFKFIDKDTFNLPIKSTKKDNCKIYITHIKVIDSKQQVKFFTLFEQNDGTMTLIYATNGFKGISDHSIPENIENCLKYFPRKKYPKGTKNENKDLLEGGLAHYFNHKQTKKIEGKGYRIISQQEAINNHVKKIKNRIVGTFK